MRMVNETENIYASYDACLKATYTTPSSDYKTVSVREQDRGFGNPVFKAHQLIDGPDNCVDEQPHVLCAECDGPEAGFEDENDEEPMPEASVENGTFKTRILQEANFNVMVLDECQRLRSADSRATWMAMKLKKRFVLFLSATPFMNSLQDTEGLFTVTARHARLDFPVEDDCDLVRGLLEDNFDKLKDFRGFGRLFDKRRLKEFPGLARAEKVFDMVPTHKLWWLNPQLMMKARRLVDETTFAQKLVAKALKGLQLRRSMHTPLTLPSGETVVPGADIPVHRIRLCIVSHPDENHRKTQAMICNQRYQQLTHAGSHAYSQAVEELVQCIKSSGTTRSRRERAHKDSSVDIKDGDDSGDDMDTTVDKTHISSSEKDATSPKDDSDGEFMPDDEGNDGSSEDDDNDDDFDEEISKMKPRTKSGLIKQNLLAHSYRSAVLVSLDLNYAMLLHKCSSKTAMLGVQHAEEMRQDLPGSGLRWLIRHTMYNTPGEWIPTNPIHRVVEMCRTSPVYSQLVAIAIRLFRQKKRFIVMVEQVFAQEVVVQILTELGLEVESIRASHRPFERLTAVRRFNNPDERVDALVTSMAVSCFGLNLHNACHHGIVIQLSWFFTNLHQTFGRLVRLGQRESVEWTLIKADNTYANVQEARVCNQCATQILSGIPLAAYVIGNAARLVVFEAIKAFWGQPFNRLAWSVRRPQSVADFESDTYARLGHFLTHIAECVVVDNNLSAPVVEKFNNTFDDLYHMWSAAGKPVQITAKEFLLLNDPFQALGDEPAGLNTVTPDNGVDDNAEEENQSAMSEKASSDSGEGSDAESTDDSEVELVIPGWTKQEEGTGSTMTTAFPHGDTNTHQSDSATSSAEQSNPMPMFTCKENDAATMGAKRNRNESGTSIKQREGKRKRRS
ncbi:hypothetical protein SBRCBS47491_009548 [Sporothrix bragantina]|uniref:Helicase C-terminal domain-containing protein n=1 Tax=Sporothrix bragantina TaxID=671064 RepID=A0ABP0CVN3_9PEZI